MKILCQERYEKGCCLRKGNRERHAAKNVLTA